MLGGKSLSFSLLVLGEKGRMEAGNSLSNGGHRRGGEFIPAALMGRPVASGDTVGLFRKCP